MLNGAPWGSTLVLAYAQQHPRRVTEIVIPAVTTTRPGEIEWLYRGAGRFHPEAWDRFRDGVSEDEPNGVPGMCSDRDIDAQIASVRIHAHFFSNGAWLEKGQLLCTAHRLNELPAVLVHGRHDMGSPVQTAWEPAKAWPDAQLPIIEDSGHAGSDTLGAVVRSAIEEFKNR